MTQSGVALIAGLGNPGNKYAESRHNAGFWFLQLLQQEYGFTLKEDSKHKGLSGSFGTPQGMVRVVAPQTFMNLSGDSVVPFCRFYRIPFDRVLVAYDELDLAPGVVRLKLDGGHGGHNGLRDIMQKSGNENMRRLRIGIGHPGDSRKVSGYVLSKPSIDDRISIDRAMERAKDCINDILVGDFARAMNTLHTES